MIKKNDMPFDTCAVIGLGSIGAGVVQSIAESGRKVIAVDHDPEALDRLAARIRQTLTNQRLVRRPSSLPSLDEILSKLTITTDLDAVAHCPLVVENIPEDVDLKRALYKSLNTICRGNTIFLANTSCVPIEKISAWVERRERVVGVHFMNPVPMMKTVELIVPTHATPEIISMVAEFLKSLGKRPIHVRDAPGFVINRLLMPFVNDAIHLLENDIASAAQVDQIFMGCLGHRMGPLATADLIGLDTVAESLLVLRNELNDPRYDPALLLLEKIQSGDLGRKTGRGFFEYVKQ